MQYIRQIIGDQGLHISLPMIEQCGLEAGTEVLLELEANRICISSADSPDAPLLMADRYQSKEKFEKLVQEALRLNKRGVVALAESPLAYTSLVESCLLDGEVATDKVRGRILASQLHWAINEALRPDGEQNWLAIEWRLYNVLLSYIEMVTFEEEAEQMGLSVPAVYQWRVKAITKLANFLRQELATGRSLRHRKHRAIHARYNQLSADEKQLLRMAAVFPQAIQQSLLYDLAQEASLIHITTSINNLIRANLLRRLDEGHQIEEHPEIRRYLLTLLTPDERKKWHGAAATYYQEQSDYLAAAYHLQRATKATPAAQLIIQNKQAILDRLQAPALRHLLAEFQRHELAPNLWCQLKILSGDLARDAQDIDSAIAEYAQALHATEMLIKAEAYYRRGEAFKRKDLDEALLHYDYGIELLEKSDPQSPLLLKIYIDRAWIFIQERQDFARAEEELHRAERLIGDDKLMGIKLHNAWAGLYLERGGSTAQVMHHRSQAWLAANEVQDVEWMVLTSMNRGNDYAWLLQDYTKALEFLCLARNIAHEAGNREKEALSIKAIGNCYFWLGQYDDAIQSSKMAYNFCVEMGNENWQAGICYDIAEAYAEMGQAIPTQQYFSLGIKLAQKLDIARYLQAFETFAQHYLKIDSPQFQTLCAVIKSGQITNQAYRDLHRMGETKTNKRTATRHLKNISNKGLLVREGSGRKTCYRLPMEVAEFIEKN